MTLSNGFWIDISADLDTQLLMHFNFDAFSHGQIESKLWLRDELLKHLFSRQSPDRPAPPVVAWILGGWYGVLAFLLLSSCEKTFSAIRSFDLDPEATRTANLLNNNWEIRQWQFQAFTRDCHNLDYSTLDYGPPPDLILNTACEHFLKDDWFHAIPAGKLLALQSTDMQHDGEKTNEAQSLEQFRHQYPLNRIAFAGERSFHYPNRHFKRYMLIGEK